MITWNDLSVGEREALQAIQFRKVVNVFADAMRLAGMELVKVDTENPTTFLLLTDAGRAVLAQKPQTANDGGEAVDVIEYQQAIRNLRETIAALKSEMHEIAYALEYDDITRFEASKRLYRAIASEVSSER